MVLFEPSFILAKERGFIHKVMVESDSQALVHLLNASREALLLVPLHGISNPQKKGNKKKKKKERKILPWESWAQIGIYWNCMVYEYFF